MARDSRLEYEAHEELRRDIDAVDGRWRAGIAQCRTARSGQTKLWIALGVAILSGCGALAVAVVNQAGEATRQRTVEAASDATAKQLAAIDARLVELGKELREMRADQRADRADLRARIAARPLSRDPDLVTPARPAESKRATGGTGGDRYGF